MSENLNPDQQAAGGGELTNTGGTPVTGAGSTVGAGLDNQQQIQAAVGLAGRLSKALRDSVATGSVLMSMPVTERQAIETFCQRVENQRETINAIKQASVPPSRRNRGKKDGDNAGTTGGSTKGSSKKGAAK